MVLKSNPRTLKRILNIYSVIRCIRRHHDSSADVFDAFSRKMFKMAIISEQWPIAFSWIVEVIITVEKEYCMKEGSNSSGLFCPEYFFYRDLEYDVSNEEGWSNFCNDSILYLLYKILKLPIALKGDTQRDAHIQDLIFILKYDSEFACLRVADFIKTSSASGRNLRHYIYFDNIRVTIKKAH